TPAAQLRTENGRQERIPNKASRGDPIQVRDALRQIPNDDLAYDDWIGIGLALKGALGDEGRDAWNEFSARSKKNDPLEKEKRLAGFAPSRIGAVTILRLARQYGWVGPTRDYLPQDIQLPAYLCDGKIAQSILTNQAYTLPAAWSSSRSSPYVASRR